MLYKQDDTYEITKNNLAFLLKRHYQLLALEENGLLKFDEDFSFKNFFLKLVDYDEIEEVFDTLPECLDTDTVLNYLVMEKIEGGELCQR